MVMKKRITEKERLSEEVYPVSDLIDRFVLSSLLMSIIRIKSRRLSSFMVKRERVEPEVDSEDGWRVEPEVDSEDGWQWYI